MGVGEVVEILDAGDTTRHTQSLATDACHDVDFIDIGDGDDHVRLGSSSAFEHCHAGTVASNDDGIQFLFGFLETSLILVDNRDVMALARQVLRDVVTDFTGPNNDDSHLLNAPLVKRGENRSLAPWRQVGTQQPT